MVEELMKLDIGAELVFVVLISFEILNNTIFEIIEGIAKIRKAKRKEEEEKKEYL